MQHCGVQVGARKSVANKFVSLVLTTTVPITILGLYLNPISESWACFRTALATDLCLIVAINFVFIPYNAVHSVCPRVSPAPQHSAGPLVVRCRRPVLRATASSI